MKFEYNTSGTCSKKIEIELSDDGVVESVKFLGGCHGNLQGIAALARGMKAEDVIEKISGIRCGFKNTSCPDQLSKALKLALSAEK